MKRMSSTSQTSVKFRGKAIPDALGRQGLIPGFDQEALSNAHILMIGAGGIVSHIAPTLVRKGIGKLTILDHDTVESSNLNRQCFYENDIGKNKAARLAANLVPFCTSATELLGHPRRFQDAVERGLDLDCTIAICGVDNNPTRGNASKYFRQKGIPVIFSAVSADGDHGYVFVQEKDGACIGCVFPDMVHDESYPCPGTPAIADILQAVGALSVYAVDTLLMNRKRNWSYRRVSISDSASCGGSVIAKRSGCLLCNPS